MADIDHLAEISIRVYKDPQGQMSGQIKAAGTGIAQFRALCMLIDHLCKANGWDLHKIPLWRIPARTSGIL